MGSPFNDGTDAQTSAGAPASTASATALAYLNAALGIGNALATDTAQIAAGAGHSHLASNITKGLATFGALSGPIGDIEQMAVTLFGLFSHLAASHAALNAAPIPTQG